MSETTILDLDAMFDKKMDDVETLPDFVNPPAGNYSLKVSDVSVKKFKTKPKDGKSAQEAARIMVQYEVTKTIETEDIPVKDGALFSESFMATEEGIKFFKKKAMNILNVESFEGATMKDVMEGLKGVEFLARITIRKTKGDDGSEFENVQVRPYTVAE
jgi:hypothetical protein